MKVEMFGTQKSAMPLSFSNFDFLPIYKADAAGSQSCPFLNDIERSVIDIKQIIDKLNEP